MGNQSARAVARELRRLAARLDNGEFDQAELSAMCPPQVTAQGHARPLPVLIVHVVAWQSRFGNWRSEGEMNGKEKAHG